MAQQFKELVVVTAVVQVTCYGTGSIPGKGISTHHESFLVFFVFWVFFFFAISWATPRLGVESEL